MVKLHHLVLQQFRNHTQFEVSFEKPVVIIVGDNGQGKTSIVEAVYLLASGQSFRADASAEMIAFGAELARVEGEVVLGDGEVETLEIMITHGQLQGKRTQARLYSVNRVRRRRKDFLGHFTCVVFRPEDMRLMEGSPGRRRSYLDAVLSQAHPSYAQSLSVYDQALLRRNKLLWSVREGEMPSSVLTYWNLQLIKHGQILQQHRQQYLDTFATIEFPVQFQVAYLPSEMSEERLHQYQPREIAAGHTLIGPHKDDLSVSFKWRDGQDWHEVASYGSRGQQRLAVLWLKVAELQYLTDQTQQLPLLALDDIFSELDPEVRELVMSLIQRQPTLITTTEERVVSEVSEVIPELQVLPLK